MTDRDDLEVQALFDTAKESLPATIFVAEAERRLARWQRSDRLLTLAQGAALLGLLAPLLLWTADPALQWLLSGLPTLVEKPWWLAGLIAGITLLLSPRFSTVR